MLVMALPKTRKLLVLSGLTPALCEPIVAIQEDCSVGDGAYGSCCAGPHALERQVGGLISPRFSGAGCGVETERRECNDVQAEACEGGRELF